MVERNIKLVGLDRLKEVEGVVKRFGLYSAHITLPGSWKDKKVRVRLIEEEDNNKDS